MIQRSCGTASCSKRRKRSDRKERLGQDDRDLAVQPGIVSAVDPPIPPAPSGARISYAQELCRVWGHEGAEDYALIPGNIAIWVRTGHECGEGFPRRDFQKRQPDWAGRPKRASI
jgi:hypothetical protein